ncbi:MULTISPECIES: NAD(P)/FAD-dependent oxidoreductase [Halorussus]|uniref:NAD(P)/FAD-dependent oxidoreductase n=1 Tax=Halorussus TaxID=1070314 RepID=UPI0020A1EC1B|nr:FAD-dependent oxidoreductase [Halorussus vallis]USZ77613.1 FAD-binding oxidoreductase [Halorussus vallis]
MTDADATAAARPDSPVGEAYDAIVVGGGVVGCAVARELAADRDVLVVERGRVAAEATALAAGEVTMSPSYSDEPSIADHANEFFREYDGTGDFSYAERESLELVPSEREGEARRRVERLDGEGVSVSFLDPDAVEDRHPRFDCSAFAGAVRHDDTGFVDPYTFAVTLKDDAEDRGATVLTDTEVTGLRVDDGRIAGVRTDAGDFDAPHVVVAAGWRTERFLRERVRLPVRPYRTQCVVLDPGDALAADFPMGWVPGEHVYFRPEHNGDLLVGGWSFAEDDPESASGSEDEAFRDHVAQLVPSFLRRFDRARFVNGWAGVDGATPDTRPIIDRPEAGPEGLVVATGFHGRGVMTAPVAATAVRALVDGEPAPFPLDAFALDRFESRSPDFEFRSISAGD